MPASDPFSKKHQADARKAVSDGDKAHQDALTAAAKQRITARETQAKRPANDDLGHPWPKRFFDP